MIEKLRQLKKESHMTNQQIAEKSNVPESTVARIFSGKTPNPTITTVVSMAKAMGGSTADLLADEAEETENSAEEHLTEHTESIKTKTAGESATVKSTETIAASENKNFIAPEHSGNEYATQAPDMSEVIASNEKLYENMIELYKAEIRKKDVWLSRLFWCLAGIMMFILFVLVFDILHPTFGFVKY